MTNPVKGDKFYSKVEENDGDTDNNFTCPLLQLKYFKPRKPITSRLGHKGKSLKSKDDEHNRQLFENKTAEANLGSSFQIHKPKKIINNLSNDTPYVKMSMNTQYDNLIGTSNDTYINLNINSDCKLNFKSSLPLSTKRSLYYNNKENVLKQTKKEFKSTESKKLTHSINSTSSCICNVKEIVEEIENISLIDTKNNSYYESSEASVCNHNTTLYHNIKETITISGFIKDDNSSVDSLPLIKQLDSQLEHSTQKLPTSIKYNNLIYVQSPIHFIPVIEQKKFKLPINLTCICPNENFISVKGIHYSILNTLGRGGSSIVYEVLHPDTNQVVAIKKVNLSEVDDIIAEGYLNEVNLLQNLQDCDSVIHLFDSQYIIKEKILYMVMEKGDTDLSKLIRSITFMSVHMIMYYWSEMLTIVNEIHNKGIIHSDLKPANFLLVSGRLKLIDFGIASNIQGDMTSVLKDVTTGTWNYISPECIRCNGLNFKGHKINQKSDVWSLGCILYSLIYGKTPYSHLSNTWQKLQAIAESKQNICFPSHNKMFSQGIPPVLLQSMKLCLIKDVKTRPSVVDLLQFMENTVFKPIQL